MAQKKELLQVSTMSRNGKFSRRTLKKGAAYLTVTTGFNEPTNQIAIEVTHTTGLGSFKTEHKHENALINVTFADGYVWSGDFNKLKHLLK